MKSRYSLLLTALLTGSVFADVPRSPSPSRYKDLYLQSAFTDPPPPEEVDPVINDLPDWVLVGLSKYTDGVKVKLMNKKDRSRVTIPSADATKMGFAVKEIKQDRNFIDGAVVTVQKGGMTGEVRFDPKFLVLKQSVGAAAPGVPTAAQNGGNNKNAGRTPPRPGGNTTSPSPNSPPTPGAVPKPSVPTPATNNAATNAAAKASGRSTPPTRRKRYVPRTK